jgi:hypothetical protein
VQLGAQRRVRSADRGDRPERDHVVGHLLGLDRRRSCVAESPAANGGLPIVNGRSLVVLRATEYHRPMIQGFRCKDTQALFEGGHPKHLRAIEAVATRKLAMLEAAKTLDFMRSPPGQPARSAQR